VPVSSPRERSECWGRWTRPEVEDGGGGAHQRSARTTPPTPAASPLRYFPPNARPCGFAGGTNRLAARAVFSLQSSARTLPRRPQDLGATSYREPRTENPELAGEALRWEDQQARNALLRSILNAMEKLPLVIGIAAAVLVVFWLIKKLVRLAFWGALLGVAAWIWYFKIR